MVEVLKRPHVPGKETRGWGSRSTVGHAACSGGCSSKNG